MKQALSNDGRAGSGVSDCRSHPAARGVEAVSALLPVFPHLCDPNILQIGAVREGVSFACISGDVFLIKSEVRFGTSQ